MASLVNKRKPGHDYWYVVESRRVNRQPRIVWQHYLGTAEALAARVRQTPGPVVVADSGPWRPSGPSWNASTSWGSLTGSCPSAPEGSPSGTISSWLR